MHPCMIEAFIQFLVTSTFDVWRLTQERESFAESFRLIDECTRSFTIFFFVYRYTRNELRTCLKLLRNKQSQHDVTEDEHFGTSML